MKENKELVNELNSILSNELNAICQYMIHSKMCENLGYTKLHAALQKQAMEEMHHAQWLIEHIIFFEGSPAFSELNPKLTGKTILEIITENPEDELYITQMKTRTPVKLILKILLTCLPNYLKWKKARLIGTKYNIQKLTNWDWKTIWLNKLKLGLVEAR